MDAYFCFIHGASGAIATMKIIACDTAEDLDRRVTELSNQNAQSRIEIFRVAGFSKIGDWRGGRPARPAPTRPPVSTRLPTSPCDREISQIAAGPFGDLIGVRSERASE